jgi:hypothetical protein
MRSFPFTYLVGAGDWNLFCGLSYRSGSPSPGKCARDLENWLKWVAHVNGQKYRRLVFLGRPEAGEKFGRLHGHALIELKLQVLARFFLLEYGKREVIRLGSPMVPAAHKAWGHGLSCFRLVHGASDPVVTGYLDKQENRGAESYEIGKTAAATNLVISEALHRRAMSVLKRLTGTAGTSNGSVETALVGNNGVENGL